MNPTGRIDFSVLDTLPIGIRGYIGQDLISWTVRSRTYMSVIEEFIPLPLAKLINRGHARVQQTFDRRERHLCS